MGLSALKTLCAGAVLSLFLTSTSYADQNDKRLDDLFRRLGTSQSVEKAQMLEQEIWHIWSQPPDNGTISYLMRQGVYEMSTRNFDAALGTFDEVILRAPNFAEGWNKRATVYYLIGQFSDSVSDIQRTLALEPRHFGALSGLGLIYMALEEPESALKAFEEALKIHPQLSGAKVNAERLNKQISGQTL